MEIGAQTRERVFQVITDNTDPNPRVVRVLFDMGYIEELGMGLDNDYRWLAEAGQPEPALRDTGGSFVITLRGLDMKKALAEGEALTMELAALGLNERQRRALEHIQEHGRITNREYRELGKVSHEIAYRELSELMTKGLIAGRGAGRGTHYTLVDD